MNRCGREHACRHNSLLDIGTEPHRQCEPGFVTLLGKASAKSRILLRQREIVLIRSAEVRGEERRRNDRAANSHTCAMLLSQFRSRARRAIVSSLDSRSETPLSPVATETEDGGLPICGRSFDAPYSESTRRFAFLHTICVSTRSIRIGRALFRRQVMQEMAVSLSAFDMRQLYCLPNCISLREQWKSAEFLPITSGRFAGSLVGRMSRKILAIEDDRDALANLRDILELDGFDVSGAGSFREAVELDNWGEYAVILLDRKLPDGSADDFLPRIRTAAPRAALMVITGYGDLEGTISALRNGASDYLLKPVHPDLLRAAVQRAIHVQEMESTLVQSERLAAIGQMMTVLTHESGNILARGNALLETLEMELEGSPACAGLIERLKKAHADLHRLHEEVRSYAAPIELERERWDLKSIWQQTWNNLVADPKLKNTVSLTEDVDGVDLRCIVDAFRLEQVFRNLFENAIAACSESAQIVIQCRNSTLGEQPALQITVSDNGPGLTTEQITRVFAPFYTTKPKGTGLGLAIVSRIIEAHGGKIEAGGMLGKGAVFTIILPRRSIDQNQVDVLSSPTTLSLTADTS